MRLYPVVHTQNSQYCSSKYEETMLKEATHYYYANSRVRQRDRETERKSDEWRTGWNGRTLLIQLFCRWEQVQHKYFLSLKMKPIPNMTPLRHSSGASRWMRCDIFGHYYCYYYVLNKMDRLWCWQNSIRSSLHIASYIVLLNLLINNFQAFVQEKKVWWRIDLNLQLEATHKRNEEINFIPFVWKVG